MPNRLASELSPYLRQHADNPVDWYPFGPEAFAAAKAQDRPILLSVGYSACHWCHVMAHESFEDETIARSMNERFINVKVDREELPDVDQIYQRALQLQGESGGWPLTMFLTPEGLPFFGGTYFPPDDRHGRPGFPRVLTALSKAWAEDRDSVLGQSAKYKEGLAYVASHELAGGDTLPTDGALEQAILKLLGRVDREHGGFGGAPKFPNASALRLLARGARRARRRGRPAEEVEELESAFLLSLRKMAEGGIYDQSGGGFCRYATDGVWLVPHFEKMLYDNAQLLALYAEGYQISKDPLFAHVIRGTARFLERELRAPEGALYTALDADSEGVEGRYYVWTWDELAALLSADEVALCERLLGCTREGNWRDPHGHAPPGANVISLARPAADQAEAARRDAILEQLFVARQTRVRPSTDDKVLASMNGLCVLGLAEAGRVLGDRALIDAAVRTAEFVLDNMRDEKTGRLYRSWQGGRARLPGTLDDHAYVADGLFALYEATFDPRWFDAAQALVDLALDLFWDETQRVFFLTAADEAGLPQLIERPISGHDGAVPAGASVLVDRLVTVGQALGQKRWMDIAETALRRRGERALEQPFAYAHLLGALDAQLEGPTQIVIAGEGAQLERVVAEVFLPSRLLVRQAGAPSALASLVTGKSIPQGAAAFVCRGQRCELPERDASNLRRTLAGLS